MILPLELAESVDSSFSPQEKITKLRRNMKRMMSKCLIGFLIGCFRRILHIPELGEFYKNWEDCGWGPVVDGVCESCEIVKR